MEGDAEAQEVADLAREAKELLTGLLHEPGAARDEARQRSDLPAQALELLARAAGRAREAEIQLDPRTPGSSSRE